MRASKASEQTGGIILSRVKGEGAKRLSHEHDGTACDCLCSAPFLYIKEGVGEKASAPQSAGETSAISRSEPRTKEQSNVFSPTETPLKEHQPFYLS